MIFTEERGAAAQGEMFLALSTFVIANGMAEDVQQALLQRPRTTALFRARVLVTRG